MRRFDKKKNIQKLNEQLNKKGNSLTENSWADDLPREERPYNPSVQDDREEELRDMGIHDDSFPDEFKGMYDDDIESEDPMGPSPDDLGSWIEHQNRQEIEAGISGDMDNRFTPSKSSEPSEDLFNDYDRDNRSFKPHSRFGEDVGEPMEDPALRDFPDTDFNPESLERMRQDRLYRESIGRDMNVLNEQSLKAFQRLCGLSFKKKD